MKIWLSTSYGSSNIPEKFKSYEEKRKFFNIRSDEKFIKDIEEVNNIIKELRKNFVKNNETPSLRALEKLLGIEKCYTDADNYVEKYKYSDVTPKPLINVLENLPKFGIENIHFWGLKVVELPSQKKIKFSEYDGSEYIEMYDDMDWFLV